jgi:serine/threonine-protein kinase
MAERSEPGNWRPGDTTSLVVSKGPEPVTIPDVAGMTIRQAVEKLESLGFTVDPGIADSPIIFSDNTTWDVYTVKSTDPGIGTTQPKGSTIKLKPVLRL